MLIVYEYPHLMWDLGEEYHGEYPVEYGAYQIGILEGYEALIWRRKYQGVGEFSLKVPYTATANTLLVCGNLIGMPGRTDELGRITRVTIDTDERGVEYIEARGQSLLGMIAGRVMRNADSYYSTVSAIVSQYILPFYGDNNVNNIVLGEYDTIGDIADDNYGDRRFPRLYWREPTFDDGTEEADGGFVNIGWAALENTLSVLLSACKTGNCGARIVTERGAYGDTLTLYAQLYRGIDRSATQSIVAPIVFDRKLGNISKISYTHSIENMKTAGYAICNHIETLTGNANKLVDIMSGNDYTTTNLDDVNGGSGINRAEIGITVTELAMPTTGTTTEKINALYAASKDIGKAEIAKSPEERTVLVTINPYAAWPVYRTDYDIGDTVTVTDARYGISMDAQIAESIETYEPGKTMQLQLIFGTATTTLLESVRKVAQRRG